MFMNTTTKKVATFILTLCLVAVLAVPALVSAQDPFGTGYLTGSDLPTTDVREVVINLINILLGILGIIFLLLVLYGGFLWMTAGGNDDQASKGRKIIGNGIVGLIIIFVAFAITTFVFNILDQAT
jgi:heme/copper-type cytochrome/quinol oxidase subunit 2